MLEFSNLTVGYGNTPVLSNLSLTLREGTLTAVIGPNGCGKSTLFKTALGLLPPISGTVLLDGKPIAAMRRTEVARHISYLAQSKDTPEMTVRQAVLHGRFPYLSYPRFYREEDRAIAHAAMEKMGILPYADTPLSLLSGGEKQNAYIAMALAQNTQALLLDEPTSFLDVRHAHALLKALKELAKEGRAVALVMHDLPLAFSFADSVAVLADGGLLICDTPERVLSSGAVCEALGVDLLYSDTAGYYYRY